MSRHWCSTRQVGDSYWVTAHAGGSALFEQRFPSRPTPEDIVGIVKQITEQICQCGFHEHGSHRPSCLLYGVNEESEPTNEVQVSSEITKVEPAPTEELYVDSQDDSIREGLWEVRTLEEANWALSRLGDLEAEILENEEHATREIDRYEKWVRARLEKINNTAHRGVLFFRSRLSNYALLNRDALLKGGKKKSRTFVNGSIGWRSRGGKLEIENKQLLLEWARAQDVTLGLTRIKEEPDLVAIRKHADSQNPPLIPPGMVETPDHEEIEVRAIEKPLLSEKASH